MHLPYQGHLTPRRAPSMIAISSLFLWALSACAAPGEASLRWSERPECSAGGHKTVAGRTGVDDDIPCIESRQAFIDEADEAVPFSFREGPSAPTLTLSPASGLRDRAVVTVRGQGFDVNMRTHARLCRAGTMSAQDCLPAGRPPITADDGGFYQEVIVYAGFGTQDGDWVDCTAPRSCELVVFRGRMDSAPARAALVFAVGETPPRPTLRVAAAEPLSDQQVVRVRGSGFDRGANLSLQQYLVHEDESGTWHELLSNAFVTADARGEFERTIPVFVGPASSGRDCLDARCVLAASELQGRYGAARTTLRFAPNTARRDARHHPARF